MLEAPGVYVFGELLDMPNVRELADSDFASTFRLLTVFAYGTYADYLAEARNLPHLLRLRRTSFDICQLSLWLPKSSVSHMQCCWRLSPFVMCASWKTS